MSKKILIGLVVIIGVILVAGGFYYLGANNAKKVTTEEVKVVNDEVKTEPEVIVTKKDPETVVRSVLEQQVQIILAQKYKKDLADVSVTVTKQDAEHAVGMVKFGQGANVEGGLFLAVKNNDVWQVVFDGNGSVDCLELKNTYNFNTDLLQGVCD